jgi:hypothetical protein
MNITRNKLDTGPVTIERLERSLAVAAHLVTLDGEVVLPLFERLERDLETMRGNQDAIGRARRLPQPTK